MLTITNYYFLHKKNTKLTRRLGHGDYIAPQGCLKKSITFSYPVKSPINRL